MNEEYTPIDPKTGLAEGVKTTADRFREMVNMPDFGVPEIRETDEIFKEAPTPLDPELAHSLVEGAKIREGVGEQTAVAIENALTGIGGLADEATLALGQLTNFFTDTPIANDFLEVAQENLRKRKEDMMYAEDSVGGVRNLIAQLAGGAVSMGELLLVSAATGGLGAYTQMSVEAFGEGAYNDMSKYIEEHGSLKGYEPKTLDVAINAGNAWLQAYIEKHWGVGKLKFLEGWTGPLIKGVLQEAGSGAVQEFTQSLFQDLAEVVKGNEEATLLLDNAEQYVRDGIVGAILQGGLGAATYKYNHDKSVGLVARARAVGKGREVPNSEDISFAKKIIDAKERGYASGLIKEFKAAFDANSGEGKLQAKIATELKRAVEAKELDLDTADETELAQRIEGIATQETMNAMDFAQEQGRAISDMELNNIVYKDGAIWLEGLEPQVGDRAVSYARVLAERQSGLAEVNSKLDAINQEIATLKQDLAEAKAENKQAQVEKLQARIDKQNALAEKNRLQAERLKVQTAKLEKQIAKQQAETPKAETVEMAQVKKKEPVAERKSLKEEKAAKKAQTSREQVIKNLAEGSDRFLKILIPKEGGSFIETNKETLDKIDIFTKADFLQRALSNDKITPPMIDEIFEAVSAMPQYESLSNVYYDIAANPKTNPETALKAKEKYSNIFTPRSEKPMESWAGKTREEVANAVLQKALQPALSIIDTIKNKDNMITDDQIEKKEKQINNDASTIDWVRVVDGILMKYELDPRVVKYARENPEMFNDLNHDDYWLRDQNNTGNAFIDVFGEYVDRIPDGYVELDELDDMPELADKIEEEKLKYFEEHNGYEESVYLLPKNQEQVESKIIQTMAEQTELALIQSDELEVNDPTSADLYDAKITTDKTPYLFQGSITGKGDTARGGYDDALKRIILGEKSDLSTIQHEFAHYWIQNNFKWARSGLASQDWLRRWRDVEEWLGIEPQDRLLSKSASEKFAKAYERYILEGKVAPELQWAFEGLQKAYQDIYEDLGNEYFDLSEELAPEVVDWFNRNKEQSPKRLVESDTQKIEKTLALEMGVPVVEQTGDNTVAMTEMNDEGKPVVAMGVQQSEIPAGDNLLVYSDKTTASKLQQSARKIFGDDVKVQQLATLDTEATLENFTNWIKRDRAGAWDAMMNPSTSPIYQAYLYKAFAQEAMNDVNLAVELANVDMAKSAREMGQALQALNINNESGFDMLDIIHNIEKGKGTISAEELNNSIEEMGLDSVELSEAEVSELENQTECKL